MDCKSSPPGREVTPEVLTSTVPRELAGERLDRALASLFQDYSRTAVQGWIRDGAVALDGAPAARVRARVAGGEQVRVRVPAPAPAGDRPQAMILDLPFEDEHLLVVNKPAGLVVHPGAGNPAGTLLNALLHHHGALSRLPRAGLVHRIDKNTSGLLVVAKTPAAQTRLVAAMAAHAVQRHYLAVVHGQPNSEGTIDAPIGRHPRHRTRMAVRGNGRASVTHFQVARRFHHHAQLQLRLETGRTHQIRVHLSHLGHPIVGDREYGGIRPARAGSGESGDVIAAFQRQALHAHTLILRHPVLDRCLRFQAEVPPDMQHLIQALERDAAR